MNFRPVVLSLRAILVLGLFTPHSYAGHYPLVPAFERFYEDKEGPTQEDLLAGGRLLFGELNCASCHIDNDWKQVAKQPPLLEQVAARVKPAYLERFIADPHATKPGTTMPDMLGALPVDERMKAAEALVHFLASKAVALPKPTFVPVGARQHGEKVFHEVGCVACHGPKIRGAKCGDPDDGDPDDGEVDNRGPENAGIKADHPIRNGMERLPHAVPLGDIDSKYTVDALTEFLLDPLHVRQSGRMPDLGLSPLDARSVAAYLIPSAPEKPGIQYAYYEGSWNRLPNFSTLTPIRQGSVDSFDFSKVTQRDDHFGVVFTGLLEIGEEQEYEFDLGSDDGSRLIIDGKVIIDHDGVHGFDHRKGKSRLEKGRHPVVLEFFEQAGGEALELKYRSNDGRWQDLAPVLLSTKPTADLQPIEFLVRPEMVEQGKRYFISLGCHQCHAIDGVDSQADDVFAGLTRLGARQSTAGCLAESPAGKAPNFGLTTRQRNALTAFVRAGAPVTSLKRPIHSRLEQLNCYACHQRDGRGGIVPELNRYFTGTQPEMGDEGRVPPLLNGVGAKIKPDYLTRMLAKGGKDRPYMRTKMPGFGERNTASLAASLTNRDKLPETLPTIPLDHKEAKQAAWEMVGAQGFGCIKCHTFGRFEATGVQSIDLTIMTKRLNENWFRQYVRNPIAFRPGTRMPSAWPATGPSMLKKILDADSDKQIQAVWNYLRDGVRARVPAGLGRNTQELIPSTEAIIYRNFIEGAGTRAIGVGFPEGFHIAFDANDMRLALIWQGAFIDASRHWKGRGQGFQPPLGDRVVNFSEGVAFALHRSVQDSQIGPWPQVSARKSDDYQFLGYSLTPDQRPTFKYRVGKYTIHDTPNPIDDGRQARLVRTIQVTAQKSSNSSQLWYRAATGDIEQDALNRYRIDDLLISLEGNVTPRLRGSEAGKELIIEVRPGMTFKQIYQW